NTHVIPFGPNTLEVATPVRDALGEAVYCFIEKDEEGYLVSDDGRTLFKLDPSASDGELAEMAARLARVADCEFNQENGVLAARTKRGGLVDRVMTLTQLQVAVSYLA
ncbi:DUF1828 domain-containing protein, partial [Lactobacillus sp. XV13L]|nr:DUF1828 domain-containing protein [Lactobacillus sp. XV13L]